MSTTALHSSLINWAQGQSDRGELPFVPSHAFFAHHLARIQNALSKLGSKRKFDVLFFSHRPEYFDSSEINSLTGAAINSVTFCANESDLWKLNKKFDIAIACTHLVNDHLSQAIMRSRDLASVIVSWAWDNHHLHFENLCNNCLADIVLPAHAYCAGKLRSPFYVLGRSFPLCTGQWSIELADSHLAQVLSSERRDALYGGYILWEGASRNEKLRELQREIPGNRIVLIDELLRDTYFDLSPEERLRDWSSYKVSIQIPLERDLSLRVFDALFTGQIPLVPKDCCDLDRVIPRFVQESLPILRIDEVSVSAVTKAWRNGIKRFDEMGANGVRKRHEFAREHHHIRSRVLQIVDYVSKIGNGPNVQLSIDDYGVGLVDNS